MALLARVAIAAGLLTGCYSPQLRDCTVSCESSADCAGAQVCGADHLCAAKGTSCASSSNAPQDATAASDGEGPSDAPRANDAGRPIDAPRPIDAAPPVDAPPPPVNLHLHVDGHGQLTEGAHTCTADCTYAVARGVPLVIVAQALGHDQFIGWTQGPCVGQPTQTCMVTPTANVTVAVRFHKED